MGVVCKARDRDGIRAEREHSRLRNTQPGNADATAAAATAVPEPAQNGGPSLLPRAMICNGWTDGWASLDHGIW